jgi:bacillopeptidase F
LLSFFTSSATCQPDIPGNYPETISVGATDSEDNIALFSSRGPNNCNLAIFPDISAPGFIIFSSAPGDGYEYISGTSAAAPHVTGTIALLLDANPDLSVEAIESTLQQTATHLGFFQPNFDSGWGRIDALKAVNAVIPD